MQSWPFRIAIAASVLVIGAPAVKAQTCSALKVVGTPDFQVEKKVSPPSTVVTGNNWNTDFAIPGDRGFRRYVTTVLPQNDGEYRVQVSLKYADESADKVFDRAVTLRRGNPFRIGATPRTGAKPYQVNLFVGGVPVVGDTYTASVAACR